MIGWFGLDYKPLTMLWSVLQGLVVLRNDILGFLGHVLYYFLCFQSVFEARLAVGGKKYLRLAVSG